jgi:exodeoxyribonuclease V alpha subunit
VLLVLPEHSSPLLTRSLFYTGITRAKQKVEIWALAPRISEAVSTRAERAAGLAQRLANRAAIVPVAAPSTEQLGLFE